MKFSTRITLVVALFCALTTLVRAQHSLQIDNGLGAITIITGSSTGGTYTFPPGGGTIMTATPGGVSPAWLTTGNNGTVAATNFLGTIDNIDFVTRTNNIERLRITGGGLFGIGTTLPDGTFEIKTAGFGTRASLLTLTAPTQTPNAITFKNTLAGPTKDFVAYLSDAGTLHFGPYSGTGALSISNSEFVGIGIPAVPAATSIPTERLEVRNGNILISNSTATAGQLQFQNPAATFRTTFKAGAQLVALNYTLPILAPTAGQVLSSAVGGALSWVTPSSGWALLGNAGTIAGTNFAGTTDNIAYEIHVFDGDAANKGSKRVMRYEPNASSANILGGYQGNTLIAGVVGATISGGGNTVDPNSITDDYGTVGGGARNQAGDNAGTTSDAGNATVGGGRYNIAGGSAATVGGGWNNTANGNTGTIAGGVGNMIDAASSWSAIPGGIGLTLNGSQSFGFNAGNSYPGNAVIAASNVAYLGNVDLWLGNTNNTARQLRFYQPQATTGAFPVAATKYTAFKASATAQATDITYTLPAVAPTANQVLSSDVLGVMSWAANGLTLPYTGTLATPATTAFSVTATGLGSTAISGTTTDALSTSGNGVTGTTTGFGTGVHAISTNLGTALFAENTGSGFVSSGVALAVTNAIGNFSPLIQLTPGGSGPDITSTNWNISKAGVITVKGLQGAAANQYAEKHTLVAGDGKVGNVVTINNSFVSGLAGVVVVANLVSAAGAATFVKSVTTAAGSVSITLDAAPINGDIINYIVVNP